jgi:predicted ATPase
MDFDQPPVVRAWVEPERALPDGQWPMTIPAVAQLAREGLELSPFVTFLVGENGSGKSTLVEAVATAYGLSPEGGSAQGHHSTRVSESPLGASLRLERGLGASRWGFFLRAETMHGWYTYYEESARDLPPGRERGPRYHEMSHGESFLEVLRTRFDSPGFYCLDEPEAALSFSSTLGLIGALGRIGATILEAGDWGYRRTTWEELELVHHWRTYLEAPGRYLRHVLD